MSPDLLQTIPKEHHCEINFSAVILTHVSPHISVSVATFADIPTVETLVSIPLNIHSTNTETIAAGERLVYSLRIAIEKLANYYSTQVFKTKPVRSNINFPYLDFYEIDKKKHYFVYEHWEDKQRDSTDKKRIYRAHMKDDGSHVIIKFTRRYSKDAHRAASDANIAPRLLAVNEFYGWYMIVMDDISGAYVPADRLDLHIQRKMQKEALTAVKRLHDEGFVHGDVRNVNLLIRRSSVDDGLPSVKLVDFDWGGAIGQVSYPSTINSRDRMI
ncbi:hypothetical protein BDP27DRAFT_701831 [Rhodocollybia butyracea]|uniref:Protein kinase domain-containing protein n=1 Tax=Rhodocollybia butyracea TaxID=206335 RepID=A0A9P5Q7U9_9AGAR|nr:hypothetical protein BDP27DRAFT_701831 [Rhodocollybia butyracea]